MSLTLAILRGLTGSSLAILFGMLEDLRMAHHAQRHIGLIGMGGATLTMGLIALYYAWLWSGMNGPVQALAARATGIAMGMLIPAIAVSHALYFHWAGSMESGFGRAIIHLAQATGILGQRVAAI